jgi:aspartate carbamoyltransferase catalytic subunit
MPDKVTSLLQEKNIAYAETTDLAGALTADVLYMTRVQKERFEDSAEYERLKHAYILTAAHLEGRDCTVMHPLPRVGEVADDVDALPTAAYFREAHNGVPMRMALIAELLGLG